MFSTPSYKFSIKPLRILKNSLRILEIFLNLPTIAQFQTMKKINLALSFLLFGVFSCSNSPQQAPSIEKESTEIVQLKEDPRLVELLAAYPVNGSVLIWDPENRQYFSNDFARTTQGFLPASTFKIPNTLIGLETGYLADEKHIFKWNGEQHQQKILNKDLDLRQAFQASCVPCYRELARGVGYKSMQLWVNKLAFGKMVLSEEELDLFWLRGNTKITQMEQVDFLKRFYEKELPISDRNHGIMKKIMLVNQTETYQLSAKSGMSVNGDDYLAWYVGFVEKGEKVYYFATNIEPKESPLPRTFSKQRIEISLKALSLILEEEISLN